MNSEKESGESMHGQWIGNFKGTNSGIAILDFDDCGTHYEGHAVAWDESDLPATSIKITTKNKDKIQNLEVNISALHPYSGDFLSRDEIKKIESEITFPEKISLRLELRQRSILVAWSTQIGTKGKAVLHKNRSHKISSYIPNNNIDTWDKFKNYAIDTEPNRYIFRGQGDVWRLKTSFHRTNRKNLLPYIELDIPYLHRILTSRTKHLFDIRDPLQNGAFWNLIQHHGYPTPLLDWSHSPFVAAFFAFKSVSKRNKVVGKSRIFMFDRKSWCHDFNQLQKVAIARPHFSILEALAIENDRAIPQQSLSSITNIDDIEGYIMQKENESKKSYLTVIDLPHSERDEVLRELGMMGITSASLFPGLDGACEEAKNKFFVSQY